MDLLALDDDICNKFYIINILLFYGTDSKEEAISKEMINPTSWRFNQNSPQLLPVIPYQLV